MGARRSLFLAVAASVAATAGGTAVAAVPQYAGPAVGDAGGNLAAVPVADGTVRLIGGRDVAVPRGCALDAVRAGLLALTCRRPWGARYPVTVETRSGAVRELALRGDRLGGTADAGILDIGRRWISISGAFSPDMVHTEFVRYLVPVGGGAVRTLPRSRSLALDLDSATGTRRLCARALPAARRLDLRSAFDATVVDGLAVLRGGTRDVFVPCKSGRALELPARLGAQTDGRSVFYLHDGELRSRDLRTNRLTRRPLGRSTRGGRLTLTRSRVLVSLPDRTGTIWSISAHRSADSRRTWRTP